MKKIVVLFILSVFAIIPARAGMYTGTSTYSQSYANRGNYAPMHSQGGIYTTTSRLSQGRIPVYAGGNGGGVSSFSGGSYSTSSQPQSSFQSTSSMRMAVAYSVPSLNTDGSVATPQTAMSFSGPRRGLDLDEEDENGGSQATGSLTPIGDIPWMLVITLGTGYMGFVGLRRRRS